MTAQHVATATPLTKELVEDMRAELVHWMDLWAPSLSGECRVPEDVVKRCVGHVIDEAVEHVQIRFATTLATFGVDA